MSNQVSEQVFGQVIDQVNDQVRNQVKFQAWDQVIGHVRFQLWEQLRDQLLVWEEAEVVNQVRTQVLNHVISGGQMWNPASRHKIKSRLKVQSP